MRSSNAPFTEQGFSEIIRDLERHELLLNQGGDTDPDSGTNLGYTDAPTTSQEDIELSVAAAAADAVAEHEAKADPHPQYLLAADYSAGFTPTYIEVSGSSQSLSNGVAASVTTGFGTASGTMSASWSGGVFTAPGSGFYTFSVNYVIFVALSAADNVIFIFSASASGSGNVYSDRNDQYVGASGNRRSGGCLTFGTYMSTGDTASFTAQLSATGFGTFTSASVTINNASVVRNTGT